MEHRNDTDRLEGYGPVNQDTPPFPPPPPVQPGYGRRDLPYKSAALSIVLSVVMPGMGQVYLGYYRHAFTMILIFASVIAGLSSGNLSGLEPLFGIFLGFFYFYQIIDAGRRASLINRYLDSGGEEKLPDLAELPDAGGALFAGGALVVIGVLALMNSVLDVSMEWLEDWWPLGLIVLGGWIIYRGRSR